MITNLAGNVATFPVFWFIEINWLGFHGLLWFRLWLINEYLVAVDVEMKGGCTLHRR